MRASARLVIKTANLLLDAHIVSVLVIMERSVWEKKITKLKENKTQEFSCSSVRVKSVNSLAVSPSQRHGCYRKHSHSFCWCECVDSLSLDISHVLNWGDSVCCWCCCRPVEDKHT